MLQHRMAGEAHLRTDPDAFVLGLHAVKLNAALSGEGRHALQPLEEIEMPPRAAEFAVSGEFQSDVLLFLDDLLDFAIFDLLELRRCDRTLGAFGARIFKRRRAQ